jgi:hypothetical protein
MPSPGNEVAEFLRRIPTAPGRELEVATAYAELMVDELRAAVADWEATAALLRRIKGRADGGGHLPGGDDARPTRCPHGGH